ncbi:putative reverse transcriptase/retrotransposon-derived protein, RNase H [Helianthus annuus]|nr:putative reverse transcriptase/retrotransposon-derived protein, RNase H [Helianthus annuus]
MATSKNSEAASRVIGVSRVLPTLHKVFWYDSKATHGYVKKRCIPLGRRGIKCLRATQTSSIFCTGLALPDSSKQFVVETNALACGLGAVLMQERHPISFLSEALSPKQQALSVYERELLAIMMVV